MQPYSHAIQTLLAHVQQLLSGVLRRIAVQAALDLGTSLDSKTSWQTLTVIQKEGPHATPPCSQHNPAHARDPDCDEHARLGQTPHLGLLGDFAFGFSPTAGSFPFLPTLLPSLALGSGGLSRSFFGWKGIGGGGSACIHSWTPCANFQPVARL